MPLVLWTYSSTQAHLIYEMNIELIFEKMLLPPILRSLRIRRGRLSTNRERDTHTHRERERHTHRETYIQATGLKSIFLRAGRHQIITAFHTQNTHTHTFLSLSLSHTHTHIHTHTHTHTPQTHTHTQCCRF